MGIGPKAAAAILAQFGSLEEAYRRIEEVPQKWRGKLEAQKEQAFLCRELATLNGTFRFGVTFRICALAALTLIPATGNSAPHPANVYRDLFTIVVQLPCLNLSANAVFF